MVKDKTQPINRAFCEVYDIINHLDKDLYEKIPKKFIQVVEQNRMSGYKVEIDYNKSINEQFLLKDTRIILSLIYRDYICAPETRQQLLIKDKKEIEEEEKILQEKYAIDFKKINKRRQQKINDENTAIAIPEIKWYHKLFRFIFDRKN